VLGGVASLVASFGYYQQELGVRWDRIDQEKFSDFIMEHRRAVHDDEVGARWGGIGRAPPTRLG
jgi:hypothetical protein